VFVVLYNLTILLLRLSQATKITIDVIGKVICDHDFKPFEPDATRGAPLSDQ
jgi:hypothetical protein